MTIQPILGAVTNSSPGYAPVYSAGYWVFVAALVGGIVKCSLIARRPNASAKALSALIFLLGTWTLVAIAGPLLQHFGGAAGQPLFAGAVGLLMMGGIVTSVVLAILGLVDCAKRRDIYKQGTWQAVSVLLVNALFAAVMVAGLVNVARSRSPARSSQPSAPIAFTNLNFSLALPGRPWSEWNVQKINPNATFAMMRSSPGMFFMVIAEAVGADTPLTVESYCDLVQTSIRSRAESTVSLGARHKLRNGVYGVEMETQATLGANKLHYVHRIVVTNGYAYQIFVW